MLLLPTSLALLPPAHSVAVARRHAVPVAAESPPPFTISRKGLYRLAVVTGYASLLLAVSKAEEDPAYQTAVARRDASEGLLGSSARSGAAARGVSASTDGLRLSGGLGSSM